ncbi:host-nuclease inhibitor Gam family protein [Bernardetia sp. Wsw4-3y2]|uniref:host-nuclease inhibitor Gam family protein n=1 Tax=Bernardetia sp. Wsw4-3y2 TaxID=3127471 RepID=UPI0030D2F872
MAYKKGIEKKDISREETEKALSQYRLAEGNFNELKGELDQKISELQAAYSPKLEELQKEMDKQNELLEFSCELNDCKKLSFEGIGEIGFRKKPTTVRFKKTLTDEDVHGLINTFVEESLRKSMYKESVKVDKTSIKKMIELEQVTIDTLNKCGLVVETDQYKFYVKTYDLQR